MIKTCKVIWKNPAIALVDFGGKTEVQVPAEWLDGDEVVLKKVGDSFYRNETEDNDEPAVEYVGIAAEPETEENA